MLNSTLQIYEGNDICKYKQILAFLKNESYEAKKLKLLTFEQITEFVNEWCLFIKIALIFV